MRKMGFILAPALILVPALILAACAPFGKEVVSVPCPPISAVAGVEQIYIASEQGQVIAARFNGIDSFCRERAGYTAVDLAAHVLAGRNLTNGSGGDKAEIYLTAAVVDGADRVVWRRTIREPIGFGNGVDKAFPIMSLRLQVPPAHRVVLGLGRAAADATAN